MLTFTSASITCELLECTYVSTEIYLSMYTNTHVVDGICMCGVYIPPIISVRPAAGVQKEEALPRMAENGRQLLTHPKRQHISAWGGLYQRKGAIVLKSAAG